MVLTILIVISILLTLLFAILMAFILEEKVQVFLGRTLMSDDEIYQVYYVFIFTMVFIVMFITLAATYNTFIK